MDFDFLKYKKQLEDYLIKMDFMFSGDVINSKNLKFKKDIRHQSFSSIFISEIMVEIYNWSFEKMMEKSKDIIVHRNKFTNLYGLLNECNINTQIIFYSKNSNINLNLGALGGFINEKNTRGYLPSYFTRSFKLTTQGNDVSVYYSPLIEDTEDDCYIYLVDRPIQSMVWSLQNMTYDILEKESSHEVNIPVYYCDYNVHRVRIIDTQKIREEKINTLLDGN
jgi:hypothetical protein